LKNEKFKLKSIGQIGIVVEDIQKAVESYWNSFGIGPWSIYTAAPPDLTDTFIRGKPVSFSMKLAFARVGSMMLELIQPLEGESIYEEFIREKGGGMHHVATYDVEDMESALSQLEKQGIRVLQRGRWRGASFAYLDTEKTLGIIVELVKRTGGFPTPESTYP